MLQLQQLSDIYEVRRLGREDVPAVLALCQGNPLYYEYCPPAPSQEGILQDMEALPKGKSKEDKYYLGFFCRGELAAVMDLILGYPKKDTVWIGFFMMDQARQGQGKGSQVISGLCSFLHRQGFARVELAYTKGNPQSCHFWRKNQFLETGREAPCDGYTAVVMKRGLKKTPVCKQRRDIG